MSCWAAWALFVIGVIGCIVGHPAGLLFIAAGLVVRVMCKNEGE